MTRTILIFMLAAATLGVSSCNFRTATTNVRGTVTFEGKPVTNAEVRMAAEGKEAVGETNYDGRYSLSLEHPSAKNVEVKILKVGFIHDKIEFPGQVSDSRIIDIELKRVFTPGSPASPTPAPSR